MECLGPSIGLSHSEGLPALFLKGDFIGRCGVLELPGTARSVPDFGLSAGDPHAETLDEPVRRRGVLTTWTLLALLLSDPEEDTLLMLTRSAVMI